MMVERFLKRLDWQFAMLSFFIALSFLCSNLFSFQPLVRANVSTFIRGIIAGFGLLIIRLLGQIGREFLRKRFKIANTQNDVLEGSRKRIGAALVLAGGEELLLRGFIFAPLLVHFNFFGGSFLAYIINALLSFGLHSKRNIYGIERAIEGTLLALLYSEYHSIFILFIARFVAESVWMFTSAKLTRIALGEIHRHDS